MSEPLHSRRSSGESERWLNRRDDPEYQAAYLAALIEEVNSLREQLREALAENEKLREEVGR